MENAAMKKKKKQKKQDGENNDLLFIKLLTSNTTTLRDTVKNPENISPALSCLAYRYSYSNNPIYAIMAFDITFNANFYPPQWVYNSLADIFKIFLENLGNPNVSLDVLFGLKRKGKGKGRWRSSIETTLQDDRDIILITQMFILEDIFGYKVKEAREIVYDISCNQKGFASISDRTLQDIHADYAKSSFRVLLKSEIEKHWTEIEKAEFLKQFQDS